MNWFYIDTHERGVADLGFLDSKKSKVKKHDVKPGELMKIIEGNFKKDDIASASGIIVVRGPGSFSAIRAGVLIANLLSRTLGKPLYGITVPESTNLESVITEIESGKLEKLKYADPIYDSEPNITKSKKL
jgi:tRNA A37 threonylcarbamoyladenosine modification protein TsaB